MTPEEFPVHVPASADEGEIGSVAAALRQNPALTGEARKQLLGAVRKAAAGAGAIPAARWREQVQAIVGKAAEGGWLRKALPATGWVIPFSANALPLLHAAIVVRERAAARRRFHEELRVEADRLREALAVDDARKPAAAADLAAGLGMEAGLFDTALLSRALERTSGGVPRMPAARRERLAAALQVLEGELTAAQPACWVVGSSSEPEGLESQGAGYRQCADPFLGARELLEGNLQRLSGVLRALRLARHVFRGGADADTVPEGLERLDWHAAERWEIEALPAVVVVAGAEEAVDSGGFGRLLRSRLPVQILVARQGLGTSDCGAGMLPDPGAVARSFGEAYVLESSLVRLDHLLAGLRTMAGRLYPAVAVVNVPCVDTVDADELGTAAIDLARVFPLAVYDPDRGASWAERFRLQIPETPSPVQVADAAALIPSLAGHFAPLPGDDAEALPLEQLLARPAAERPKSVPHIDAKDSGGRKIRLGVSRQMVAVCRERIAAWRLLEELAGVRSVHAERAREQTRQEMEAVAVSREQTAAERARKEGAASAVQSVMRALLEPRRATAGAAQPAAPTVAVVAAAASPAPAVAEAPRAAPPAPAAQSQAVPETAEPYIDSFLCTSCNDCMKVNPRLFLYNANKQAYLADPSVGTFAELLKAAEGCPARCIHVGTPRPGDATATPALLAKSAKFR
jgi:ferredoxin